MPLTDAAIRKAKPGQKTIRLSDEKGMYLEIDPGGGRWWRLKYRFPKGGKEKRHALGVYPEVSLADARKKRDAARDLLAKGIDPGEARKAERAVTVERSANSFEAVAREWHAKFSPSWDSVKYRDITIRRLELNAFPWLGDRVISEITAPELLAVIRRIEERDATYTAHRILGLCGQVFRYAIATSRAERDITPDLRGALAPRQEEHFAATTEPKRLAEILRAFDGYHGSIQVRSALKLAPMVFVRPGELRHALWSDFDLESAEWRYLVTKTQTPHIVPLATQALAILKEIQPITGRGRYVFPCARTTARPMSDNAVLAAMRRMGVGDDEMTGHGLRAVARTILDEVLEVRPDFIEHQLAHTVKDPNGRAYNRTAHLSERRVMMQKWADYLDGLKKEKT